MKLKQTPADFRVEELTPVVPGDGPFAFYRLDKVGWNTSDALGVFRRAWKLDANRVGYGGLKDRHADTTQYITIHRGPPQNFDRDRIRLTYLGQVPHAFTSTDIAANRFSIVLRDLTPAAERAAVRAASEVAVCGVPNYFDDQRFGGVNADRKFVAHEMVLGRFEDALKLALANPYEHDRAADKKEKATLLAHWGDWPAAKAALPRGHARSLVDFLVSHPTDFKGALARLRPDMKGLILSVYQSDVWNRVLGRWIRDRFPADALGTVDLRLGRFPVPLRIPEALRDEWATLSLPLPSARLKPPANAPWLPAVQSVLADDGLTLETMKVKGLDKPYFSKGDRAGSLVPTGLAWESAEDELNRLGRRKLTLRFDLPRGCYATMIVKRVTAVG